MITSREIKYELVDGLVEKLSLSRRQTVKSESKPSNRNMVDEISSIIAELTAYRNKLVVREEEKRVLTARLEELKDEQNPGWRETADNV
jgi:hypothetical protein